MTLAYVSGTAKCYYEGVHYRDANNMGSARFSAGTNQNQYRTNWNPDDGPLRVTENQVSHLVHQVAAATHPTAFDVDVAPAAFLGDQDSDYKAQVHETAIGAEVIEYGMVARAQLTNLRRSINGTHLLGLAIENRTANAGGKRVPDRSLKFFEGDSANLILDPACQELELHEHPYVIYHDTWTVAQIKTMFGIDLNPEDCQTIEQLEPVKIELNTLSEGRLYSRYARFSKSKGARVFQIHDRDETGYFGKWQIVVQTNKDGMKWMNEDDQESPFGGCGMPFVLLHAHLRADTMWSWGDVGQSLDDQKKLNLASTLFWRIVLRHAGSQWVVDRRAFGAQATSEEIRRKLTNQVYGAIDYTGSDRARNHQPPQLITHPPPPQFLQVAMDQQYARMRTKSSRSAGNEGVTQTHTPNSTFRQALQEADQPLGVRVNRDLGVYEQIMGVMHGTTIKLARAKNPSTLAMLRDAGFDIDEFVTILQADPMRVPVKIKIRESSVRYRPLEAKQAALDKAAEMGMVTPAQYQAAMVEQDTGLTREASQMAKEAAKAASSILSGQSWQPRMLGEWSEYFIKAFIKAGFDRRAKQNPKIGQLLDQAVQLQRQVALQEAISANPELAVKQQEAAAGGGNSGAQSESQAQTPDTVSIADLLKGIQGGAQGVPASAS